MKIEQIKIHTSRLPGRLDNDVTLYMESGDRIVVLGISATGELTATLQDRNADVKPTFRMLTSDLDNLAAAFVEFARAKGLPEPTKDFAAGKLLATEKHLEDMRTLVFEPKEIINVEERS